MASLNDPETEDFLLFGPSTSPMRDGEGSSEHPVDTSQLHGEAGLATILAELPNFNFFQTMKKEVSEKAKQVLSAHENGEHSEASGDFSDDLSALKQETMNKLRLQLKKTMERNLENVRNGLVQAV